jgi:hypothetical protein
MKGTKSEQALATKGKLKQVARELFAERGFADVSARKLLFRAAKPGLPLPDWRGARGAIIRLLKDELRHSRLDLQGRHLGEKQK